MKSPEKIRSKKDLVKFIESLRDDFIANKDKDEWENPTLDRYLDAMAAWIDSMEWFYKNTNQEMPKNIPWKIFGDILMAAKYYE